MWYIDIWGYLGGGFACIRFVPQIYRCIKTKSTGDISWGLISLSLLSQSCTITYAVLIGSKPLVLPVSGAFILTSTLGVCKYIYDGK